MKKFERQPGSEVEKAPFLEEKESSLEEKERGKNVRLRIKLGRHAEKEIGEVEGLLSEQGEKSAEEYGASLYPGETHGLKGYSSAQPRAERTRDIIMEGAEEKFIKLKPRSRKELDYKDIKNAPTGGWGQYAKKFLAEKYPNFDSLPVEEKYKAMQESEDYMCAVALKDDKHVEEAASKIAHFLDTRLRMADRLKEGTRAILVDVTHNTLIMAFLKKCLIIKDIKTGSVKHGFEDLAEIGGSFNPMEFFELDVAINDPGNQKITPRFENPERLKGFEWSFDLEELKRLSDEYVEANRPEKTRTRKNHEIKR